jgi:hypothetical protein
LGTGIATALAVNTGSSGAPVINGGVLGTPSSGTVTNLTGTASININGTVGATTASTGAFTTLSASGDTTVSAGTLAVTKSTTGDLVTFSNTNAAVTNGSTILKLAAEDGSGVANFYLIRAYAGPISAPTEAFNVAGSGAINAGINNSIPHTLTGSLTVTADATIQGVTVGRGAGAVSTNTAVGTNAGLANSTGNSNTYLGYGVSAAGAGNTGNGNLAAGFNALNVNTSGTSNVALGGGINAVLASALESNTSGSYNVAVGAAALKSNTTANSNTAVGYQAGFTNSTGTGNTFVGYQAGLIASTSNGQTFIGQGAGSSKTTGGNNTFVGTSAGASATTGTGNTFIGVNDATNGCGYAVTSGSKNTIIGGYTGNQNSVDIRTASNYIVLSDGDGYPAFWGLGGGNGFMRLQAGRLEFPVTANPSSDPNILDDYEEGTWTPTITFGGASVGVTYNTTFTGATYTKIGNRVCVSGYLEVTNKGSSTGDASIGNLPFTSEGGPTKYLGATVGGSSFTFANQFWARIAAASTTIDLLETTEAGAQSFITNSDCTNGTSIYFSATYTV